MIAEIVCQLPRRKSFQALEDSDPSKMFPQHENFRLKLYLIELAEHLMLAFLIDCFLFKINIPLFRQRIVKPKRIINGNSNNETDYKKKFMDK
ncbi:hypothetical protein BpHYR1_044631 [Brachionus plicatilis]|uniref:Uncharacterized protein n=1 Tax=Brachionus plicatilis TaxID=10195 RepID=A0A3M7RWJ7_BRAPC|nr:hypothetical protein BpHYR1_044631 [Brachionus plicatilis]